MEEYRLCQQAVEHLESTIWRSATVIGVGSLGTLILVAGLNHPLVPSIFASILIITTTLVWWSLAKRWWSIQYTKFTRMLQIERDLQIAGQASIVRYLDDLSDLIRRERSSPSPAQARSLRARRHSYSIDSQLAYDIRRYNWPNYHRNGPRDVLPWFIRMNISIWILFVLVLVIGKAA